MQSSISFLSMVGSASSFVTTSKVVMSFMDYGHWTWPTPAGSLYHHLKALMSHPGSRAMTQEVNAMTRQMTQLDVYLWSLGDLPTLMGYTVLAAAIPILPSARAIMFGEKTEFVFRFWQCTNARSCEDC